MMCKILNLKFEILTLYVHKNETHLIDYDYFSFSVILNELDFSPKNNLDSHDSF